MVYKTPGVYIKDISTFPPSVVPVETAIPAFVGYTDKAEDTDGNSLLMEPTRIESLLEYITFFGGDYLPATYQVQISNPGTDNAIGTIFPRNSNGDEHRYYLYGCLRHFYANGGGPCYIVSVGSYSSTPILGVVDDLSTGLRNGLTRLESFDEPTLLVFPDGVSISNDLGDLQIEALNQCEKLQDRFVIMDLSQGAIDPPIGDDPVGDFRGSIGTNNLKYGAAYYPWLQTIYRPDVHFRHLRFIDPSDNTPITDLASLLGGPNPSEEDIRLNDLVTTTLEADDAVGVLVSAVSTVANTTALTLARDNFSDLPNHFANLLQELRETPSTPVATVRQRFLNLLLIPRGIALAFQATDVATTQPDTTLPTELRQALLNVQSDSTLIDAIIGLIALEKNPGVLTAVSTTRTADDVDTTYGTTPDNTPILDGTDWIGTNDTTADITANPPDSLGTTVLENALNATVLLQDLFDTLSAAILTLFDVVEFLAGEAEKELFSNHPIMKAVLEQVQKTMSILPSSGAVAGIYATVDHTRGVWKAPANVSIANVVGPAVKINDADQADLNVHTTGKSINAIRSFTGKGTLVWGARTLAGNNNEWRYIPVRRFFNMAEESIKKATEPFVFEPNDANTWVRVRAMIENFLTLQWRAGALAGAKTEQAFFVKVGLGETMTAQDVLEGRMIVEIGMAVVRPAEFIILKFAHKMQVS
ncbi:MAG: phage tail sheath C-terminal domain-containing protein [Synechococcus sp.]